MTPACALCGGNDFARVLEGRDRVVGLPGRFTVVRCRRCTLVLTRPIPENLSDFYSADYAPFHTGRDPLRRLKAAGFQRFVTRALGRRESLRILDVGCGNGPLLAKLQRPGWTLCGLEPDAGCVERVRRMGIDARQGVLADRRFEPGFDVIFMVHVLEHVPDPLGDLQEVRRLLKPDGIFVVEVPSCDSYGFALAGERWRGLELPRHLTHFTWSTLRKMVERAGFRVTDYHRKATPGVDLETIHPRLAGRSLLNAALYPAAWFVQKLFRGSVIRMVAAPDARTPPGR